MANPLVDPAEKSVGPKRIVSLSPSTTEFCCALGLRDRLVGRSRFCDHPADVVNVPVLGSASDVSIETLVSIQPDLVLVPGTTRGQLEHLSKTELPVLALPDETLDDIFAALTTLGEHTGRPKTAAAVAAGIRSDLDDVARRYRQATSRRVLLLAGILSDPPAAPYVAGPGSFYDALLKLTGCTNAAPADGRAFGPLSLEAVLEIDPDFLVEIAPDSSVRPGGDRDGIEAWRRVGDLRAVRNGRVRVIGGSQHYVPGPRIALTLRELCDALAR